MVGRIFGFFLSYFLVTVTASVVGFSYFFPHYVIYFMTDGFAIESAQIYLILLELLADVIAIVSIMFALRLAVTYLLPKGESKLINNVLWAYFITCICMTLLSITDFFLGDSNIPFHASYHWVNAFRYSDISALIPALLNTASFFVIYALVQRRYVK